MAIGYYTCEYRATLALPPFLCQVPPGRFLFAHPVARLLAATWVGRFQEHPFVSGAPTHVVRRMRHNRVGAPGNDPVVRQLATTWVGGSVNESSGNESLRKRKDDLTLLVNSHF